jgi:hypothetical protein
MAPYRLLFLGPGHVPEESRDLICGSEAEAINAMHDCDDGRPMELWLGDRMILNWPGRGGRRSRRGSDRGEFPH